MMVIGIPKELKNGERRIGLDPEHAAKLIRDVNSYVVIESGAGEGSGFCDTDYVTLGVTTIRHAWMLYAISDVVVKVKDLVPEEYQYMKSGQALAGFYHLPANPELAKLVLDRNIQKLAYEDISDADGRRPILAAMSAIAGEVAAQKAIEYLQERKPSTHPNHRKVLIVGKGNVGLAAAQTLLAMNIPPYNIFILDSNPDRIDQNSQFVEHVCNEEILHGAISDADIVIGAAASPHREAPKIITRRLLARMPSGGVLVDVAVDEGGISETTRPTTHADPVYEEMGILHYCVPNIPGSVPQRATTALSQAAYPYLVKFIRSLAT